MGSKSLCIFLIFLGQRGMHLMKALHLYHSLEILKRGVNGYHSEMAEGHTLQSESKKLGETAPPGRSLEC